MEEFMLIFLQRYKLLSLFIIFRPFCLCEFDPKMFVYKTHYCESMRVYIFLKYQKQILNVELSLNFVQTDTASVLLEAMDYISFLHEQVKVWPFTAFCKLLYILPSSQQRSLIKFVRSPIFFLQKCPLIKCKAREPKQFATKISSFSRNELMAYINKILVDFLSTKVISLIFL